MNNALAPADRRLEINQAADAGIRLRGLRRRRSMALHWALVAALCWQPLPAAPQEEYTVNFNDSEISEMIRFIAEVTGETFLVDPRVKGKIQVISSKPVNDEELYDLFLAILNVHGYTAVHSPDGIIRIVPTQTARTHPGPVGEGVTGRENLEVVTRVIPLDNIEANKLVSVIRPLLPSQSHLAAYPPTNSIIIADSAANIAKLGKIIERIDLDTEQQVDVIKLQFADATEIERLVRALEKTQKSGQELVMVTDGRTNSILLKGGEAQRQRVLELISRLDSPVGRISNARVIYLKHAEASDLAPVLNKVIRNIEALDQNKGRNKVQLEAHDATNSLIITAEGGILKTLEAIISQLDIRRAQVLLEAIVAEIRNTDDRTLGVEFLLADSDHGLGSFSAGGSSSILRGLSVAAAGADTARALVEGLSSSAAAVEGMTLGLGDFNETDKLFAAVLRALQKNVRVNILSTPNLLTLDNTEASIVVGQNVPFLTGSFVSGNNSSVNPFQTISRRDVGITMKVTPHINEGDTVLLDIEQEVSSVTGSSQQAADIITNQRKIHTTVLAGNQEIIVLGGLITEEVQETSRKVPFLGDIPVLGRLFRSNSVDLEKTHLLVFIRPTIIRNIRDIAEETRRKYNTFRDLQLERQAAGLELAKDLKQPLLPSWERSLRQKVMDAELEDDRNENAESENGNPN